MIVHDVTQGSPEWHKLRAGILTASVASKLLTPKKREIAESSSLLHRLLAEKWLGRPLDEVNIGFAGDQGKILEEEAIPRFELETGLDVTRVGFISSDDGRTGCSPDGAIMEAGKIVSGCESKSPLPQTHCGYLIGNRVPDEYFGQVQFSLMVTKCPHWWFISYCRTFPPLILQVPRDEEYIFALEGAIALFNKKLDKAYAKLVQLNGGEPNRESPEPDAFEAYYEEMEPTL
jgi:hypothetical protein